MSSIQSSKVISCAAFGLLFGANSCFAAVPDDAQLQALVAEFGALDFFCINDTTDDAQTSDPRLQNVLTVLQGMLPAPSGFENAPASEAATAPQMQMQGHLDKCQALDAAKADVVQKRA